jgi:Fe-S cluster assembly iron-binding protein IscA
LGLALDEPKESDATYDNDTLKFLVDNELMKNCGAIKIDYADAGYRSGFSITSTIPLSGGGGGCGGSCSSGSCG